VHALQEAAALLSNSLNMRLQSEFELGATLAAAKRNHGSALGASFRIVEESVLSISPMDVIKRR